MITADLHAHTSFSSDSEEPMENALSAMVEKGLKTVCFTEHMDMDYPGGEFLLDAAAYRSRKKATTRRSAPFRAASSSHSR